MSSQSKPSLRLAWCTHKAAVYATTHWHYSESHACTELLRNQLGVWEEGNASSALSCLPRKDQANATSDGTTVWTQAGQTRLPNLARVALKNGHSHARFHENCQPSLSGLLRKQAPANQVCLSVIADPSRGTPWRHLSGLQTGHAWALTQRR